MIVDSLAFAARRNVPVRYNRDLVATTLKAMARVSEIRARRERAFYRLRMQGNRERKMVDDRKLVEENQHLLPPDQRTVPLYPLEETAELVVLEEEGMEMELDAEMLEEEEIAAAAKIKSRAPKVKQRATILRAGGVTKE
jgi:large subunit ribosomal protein L24e